MITTAAAAQVLQTDINQIKDPGILLEHVDNSFMFYAFTIAFVFATIGVNIVANFVSAAFDISNINPRRISFRTGGLITAVVSIVVTPWNYFNNPVIVGYFLGSLGALLGPFFGILVADYYLVRKQKFSLRHMYLPDAGIDLLLQQGREPVRPLFPHSLGDCLAQRRACCRRSPRSRTSAGSSARRSGAIIYYFMANNRVIVLPTDEKRTGPSRLATARA